MSAVDLAVVGAGPAGCTAALVAAQRGLTVALFDPLLERGHDKPCGEGILPAGVRVLRALGLHALERDGQPFDTLRFVLPDPARHADPARAVRLDLPLGACGRAVERPVLARALRDALHHAPNIVCVARRALPERPAEPAAVWRVGPDERDASVDARVVIRADGLPSRRTKARRAPRRTRTGLRARFEAREALRSVEVHAREGVEVYLTPLPKERVNVAVLFERDARHTPASDVLRDALGRHPLAARRLGAQITPATSRQLTTSSCAPVDGRCFFAGDAAGGVDPIVGCGVTVALTTGQAAGRAAAALVSGLSEPFVQRDYAALVRRELARRRQLASALRATLAHPRLARGIARAAGRAPPGLLRWAVAVAVGGAREH